jgi:uncharacterized protein
VGEVKYLIDTNILLEILLGQTRAREAKEFLIRAADEGAAISDFSLYSIGIRLFRSQQHQAYAQLIEDLFLKGKFNLISISLVEIKDLINISIQYHLDFDDAYQYMLAEHFDLIIVSFDKDFDRTARGRKEPSQILSTA